MEGKDNGEKILIVCFDSATLIDFSIWRECEAAICDLPGVACANYFKVDDKTCADQPRNYFWEDDRPDAPVRDNLHGLNSILLDMLY